MSTRQVTSLWADPDPALYHNADPDQGSQTNADPDPGQTFYMRNILVGGNRSKNVPTYKGKKPF
jgi:hypothetical protein